MLLTLSKKYPFPTLGLLVVVLAIITDFLIYPIIQTTTKKNIPEKVQQTVIKESSYADSLMTKASNITNNKGSINFTGLAKKAGNHDLYFFAYFKGDLIFWNTDKVLPEISDSIKRNFQTVERGNGIYLQKGDTSKNYAFRILRPLYQKYAINNEYLKNKLLLPGNVSKHYNFNLKEIGKPVFNSKGDYVFSLRASQSSHESALVVALYPLAFLLLLLGLTQILRMQFLKQAKPRAWIIFLVWLVTIFFISFYVRYPKTLFEQAFFTRPLLDNLGQLITPGSFFLIATHIAIFSHFLTKFKIYRLRPKKTIHGYIFLIGFFTVSLGFSHLITTFINKSILEGNVYLSLQDISGLNFISLLTISALFFLFYSFITISFWLYNCLRSFLKNNYTTAVALLLLVVLGYQLLVQFNSIENYHSGLFSLLIWLGFLAFYPFNLSFYGPLIFLVVLCSGYSTIYILNFNEEKEVQKQKRFATQVTYQRDPLAENLFANISEKIKKDQYIENYFFNPLLPKNFLKKRIKQLYFNRYLNKYRLTLHTYKYGGIPYKSNTGKNIDYFKNLINKYGLKAPAKNLYYINKTGTNPAYLAIYQFKGYGTIFGTLVIELKEKVFYKDRIYPDLLIRDHVNKSKSSKQNYNYAIYKNNNLIDQQGIYPYRLKDTFPTTNSVYKVNRSDNYIHLLHQVSHNAFAIVSRSETNLLAKLSIFSSLFIYFFIFSLFVLFVQKTNWFSKLKLIASLKQLLRGQNPFHALLFKRKIQLMVLLTALLIMLTVGISTVTYLREDFKNQLISNLDTKTKKVVPVVENFYKNNDGFIKKGQDKPIFALIRQLTKRFQTDINLYGANGALITSSQPRIFKKGIISPQMNPSAFKKLRFQNQAHLIKPESIGTLDYLASYAPIRDANNQVVAFVQLPYFSQQPILQKEINTLGKTLLNLYILIFLVVIFVSLFISNTLTRPLNLIREKLRKTQLDSQNEPINWRSKDELGQLINEYNRMITELEQNAQTLARTEREGAWREMARQVAHEIKNPLTPMKLNIQHLQQQFKHESKGQAVERVSRILTSQIDHLAKIADDFSDFAKISLGNPEPLNPANVLPELFDFFGKHQSLKTEWKLSQDLGTIWVDPNHFNRIITNLVKNALEAMENQQNPCLTLGGSNIAADTVCIWLQDNGPGIPVEEQHKVFQPNFSTKTSGTGLGLAMIKKMMESAGGTITFDSKEGSGTTFYLYFKRHT